MPAIVNKDVVRQFFRDIADNTNLAAAEDIIAPTYVGNFSGAPGPMDRAGALHFMGMFHAAFPGVTHTIEDLIAEGDAVAARITVRGAHQHEFMGLPPTGRTFDIGSINVFRLHDGKIVEQHVIFDNLGMMQQIGAIPAPNQAPA
jgi:steroid delta-isomerase-like uncharacterized protein